MRTRTIFIILVLHILTFGFSSGQNNDCFSDPLDIQLKNRFSQKCSRQIVSKNSSMYSFRDSLGYYHAVGLYFLERCFYYKDEIFNNFVSQLNEGYDTIILDTIKIVISELQYFQVNGDSKLNKSGTPRYYLNSYRFADSLKCVYFFDVNSYRFLSSTTGIKNVYINHLVNGDGKKDFKYPKVFYDAESLFLGGRFEKDYDKCFPNIRVLRIRSEKDFRFENFRNLEKIYFISFSFSELMRTNVLSRSKIDIYMSFYYDIDYEFELIGNLNLNEINSLNLCFPLHNSKYVNRYISVINEFGEVFQLLKGKVKVSTFNK